VQLSALKSASAEGYKLARPEPQETAELRSAPAGARDHFLAAWVNLLDSFSAAATSSQALGLLEVCLKQAAALGRLALRWRLRLAGSSSVALLVSVPMQV